MQLKLSKKQANDKTRGENKKTKLSVWRGAWRRRRISRKEPELIDRAKNERVSEELESGKRAGECELRGRGVANVAGSCKLPAAASCVEYCCEPESSLASWLSEVEGGAHLSAA